MSEIADQVQLPPGFIMGRATEFCLTFLLQDQNRWVTPRDLGSYAKLNGWAGQTYPNQWAYHLLIRLVDRGLVSRDTTGRYRLRRDVLLKGRRPLVCKVSQVTCTLCGGLGHDWDQQECRACDGIGMLAWNQHGKRVKALLPKVRIDSPSTIIAFNSDHGYKN